MKKTVTFILALTMILTLSACGGGQQDEMQVLELGETFESDIANITLNEIQFADKVSLDHGSSWLSPVHGSGGLSAGDGNVFIWFSFTVKNMSKEDLNGNDVCNVVVDYKDGYQYDDAIYGDTSMSGWSTDPSISNNVGLPIIKPLGEEEYFGFIKCAIDVKADRESPLLLVFTLNGAEGETQFAYSFSAPDGTDTSEQALSISTAFNNAIDELTFVNKYAGNVNNNGSRKFADSAIESLRTSLSGIDIEYLNAIFPLSSAALPEIQGNIDSICEMLIDMGNTNSDKNVDEIKSLSTDTIQIIENLLSEEYSAFN